MRRGENRRWELADGDREPEAGRRKAEIGVGRSGMATRSWKLGKAPGKRLPVFIRFRRGKEF